MTSAKRCTYRWRDQPALLPPSPGKDGSGRSAETVYSEVGLVVSGQLHALVCTHPWYRLIETGHHAHCCVKVRTQQASGERSDVVSLQILTEQTRATTEWLGASLTEALVEDFEQRGIDPCGERGEYHTFVSAGSLFTHPLPIGLGPVMRMPGYQLVDLLLQAATMDFSLPSLSHRKVSGKTTSLVLRRVASLVRARTSSTMRSP